MTNAEKFKEVFGFGVCSQTECNDCPLHDVSSGESVCNDDEFWHSNYQGEPTIPLSAIEKIKAEIHNEITSGGKWSGGWYEVTEEYAIKTFDAIIDKAVKGVYK